jgi:ABC-2 type transport system permease protein
MHLKSALEYRLSFILSVISQLLFLFVELFTVYSLFNKFSLLETYNVYELLLGFSIVWLGFSTSEFLLRGFDHFANLIVDGKFDLLLIRPRNIYIQIIGYDIGLEKIGRVIISFLCFIWSATKVINFSFTNVTLLILVAFGSINIMGGLLIIGASACFFTVQGLEFVNIFTNGTKQLGQYPMGIYKKIFRYIFTFIIPLTIINYYPLEYLTGRSNNLLYVFLPIISFIFLLFAILIFNLGMRKYKSTGS